VPQRTIALAVALIVAKLALFLGRAVDHRASGVLSWWSLPAFLFQDVWLLCAFLPIDILTEKRARWLGHIVFWAIVSWTAINVPVARVFGTPLTAGMLRAAGGALKDSIAVYVTIDNIAAVIAVIAAAFAGMLLTQRPAHIALGAIAVLSFVIGPAALRRIESLGLHRNAVVTLARTWVARAWQTTDTAVVEAPIKPEGRALDLTHLSGAAKGRNVVWIILESTGARYLKPYGAPRDTAPHVTALSSGGITFDSAYTLYPESIKGLWAAMCSYAIAPNTVAEQYAKVPCTSIADVLHARGYRTALMHSGRFAYLGMESVVENRGFDVLEDAGKIPAKQVASFGIDDASTARRALSFVDQTKGPFFLVYVPIGGHHPYETPGEGPRPFPENNDYSRYENDIYRADHATGLLIDGLKQRGKYDNTIFVVNGDHGEAFFQHEGNFAHTLFIYEENVHVPLIVTVPGLTSAIRAPQIASLIDIPPTIVDLLGAPADAKWDGRSLLGGEPRVARFFADQATFQLGLRDGRFKAIHEVESGRTKLFDLSVDPLEKNDLGASEAVRAERYRNHLLAWSQGLRKRLN
jgi:glucan phosphoethanolaminetransferase (alkaline phosphatase superfamily)